ncbi:unnamed protein product [Danaus chrysippus]|uniref:(African queen) hypothetical protein n=1 Tax=Danaus chrysippus TaxID=151541 RepID=A0A8J2W1B5_9NEOP|nr:unnamed protein product [Danaus chrysippus]
MENKCFKILLLLLLEVVLSSCGENFTDIPYTSEDQSHSKILSRRKRYLIFPDGSSFQLVFCAQNHGYLQVGDVVWFGNTAALAWELPTDPKLFNIFKKYEKLHTAQNRDGVSKLIYYLDETGKVITKKPYRKRLIVNPAFAKRSLDGLDNPLSIQKLHEEQKSIKPFEGADTSTIDFHREGRKSLYTQLEKFLQALGWSGRECILRLLCEAGRSSGKQGTFIEEILRVTFTLPEGSKYSSEELSQYDSAHRSKGSCDNLYKQCHKTK